MRFSGFVLVVALSAVGCGGGDTTTGNTDSAEIPSEAMEPTFSVGQQVTIDLDAYKDATPQPGDVVTFHPPEGAIDGRYCGGPKKPGQPCPTATPQEASEVFVKRVVAVPGDTLSIKDGIPIVNGEPFEGDFEIHPCRGAGGCDFPTKTTISPDHYFMMGDNRGASDDSRFWGPVALDWILGRVEE